MWFIYIPYGHTYTHYATIPHNNWTNMLFCDSVFDIHLNPTNAIKTTISNRQTHRCPLTRSLGPMSWCARSAPAESGSLGLAARAAVRSCHEMMRCSMASPQRHGHTLDLTLNEGLVDGRACQQFAVSSWRRRGKPNNWRAEHRCRNIRMARNKLNTYALTPVVGQSMSAAHNQLSTHLTIV